MSKLFSLGSTVLSDTSNLQQPQLAKPGDRSENNPAVDRKVSGPCLASWASIEPVQQTAETGRYKQRPTALHLGQDIRQPRGPVPASPALTSCSRSIGTNSIETLEAELHLQQHDRKVVRGSAVFLPVLDVAGNGYIGVSHSRSQVIEMFSPRNTMSYLTSPQGAQASHQCNQDISDAFLQMKLEYKALAHDWPIENENYAIRIPSDLGMRCDVWERQLSKLIVDTIENFGLGILTEDTANIALDTCAECLQWELPRDSVFKAIEKLRQVLTPEIEYHDWCPNAPDIGNEEDVYPEELKYAVSTHYAAGESRLHHLHYSNETHQDLPCEDKSFYPDSELYMNAEFDD